MKPGEPVTRTASGLEPSEIGKRPKIDPLATRRRAARLAGCPTQQHPASGDKPDGSSPARFVEVENTLTIATQPAASGLIIEAEGLRLLLADRAAVLILADLLSLAQASRKGGRP